jgi:hypothetical protein
MLDRSTLHYFADQGPAHTATVPAAVVRANVILRVCQQRVNLSMAVAANRREAAGCYPGYPAWSLLDPADAGDDWRVA